MKRILIILLLALLCQTAFAEYVTILPVSDRQIDNVVSELVTLSDQYGKATTIRYWASEVQTPFVAALSNTNLVLSNGLVTTADLLCENKMLGLYIGADSQTNRAQTPQAIQGQSIQDIVSIADNVVFAEPTLNYQTKDRSNIALATLIEDQTNEMLSVNGNASDLVAYNQEDADNAIESGLMAGEKTTVMDTLLSNMTRSSDYELPSTSENILISGIGGAILNGYSVLDGGGFGGVGGYGGGGALGYAGAGGSSVPEPSTWAMLFVGMVALMWGRKFQVKRFAK